MSCMLRLLLTRIAILLQGTPLSTNLSTVSSVVCIILSSIFSPPRSWILIDPLGTEWWSGTCWQTSLYALSSCLHSSGHLSFRSSISNFTASVKKALLNSMMFLSERKLVPKVSMLTFFALLLNSLSILLSSLQSPDRHL